MLNSLVGEMMMIPVPFLGMNFSLYTNSTAGTRNASVSTEKLKKKIYLNLLLTQMKCLRDCVKASDDLINTSDKRISL